jgi:hypothetical protein
VAKSEISWVDGEGENLENNFVVIRSANILNIHALRDLVGNSIFCDIDSFHGCSLWILE